MTVRSTTVETPVGPFTALIDAVGAVIASGWTSDISALISRVHPSILAETGTAVAPSADLGEVTKAITAYHEGDLSVIDSIPVRQASAEFRAHAWETLRTIAAGSPVTYREFAELSGRPAAIRAAANACATNAAALFVPCHRVVRTDGGLGGFAWGVPVKKWLLAHES